MEVPLFVILRMVFELGRALYVLPFVQRGTTHYFLFAFLDD